MLVVANIFRELLKELKPTEEKGVFLYHLSQDWEKGSYHFSQDCEKGSLLLRHFCQVCEKGQRRERGRNWLEKVKVNCSQVR